MKKLLSLAMSLLIVVSLICLAGCGKKDGDAAGETVKLGMGLRSGISSVEQATPEKDGSAKFVTTVAAVMLDKDGKIVKCVVDSSDATAGFNTKGEFKPLADIKSKYEAGNAYGMKQYSAIKKEWYEQADAFASFVKGKTFDEVKDAKMGDKDLVDAGCTVDVNDFILALEKAVKNAKDSSATVNDSLKVAMAFNATVQSATAEKNGSVKIDTSASAVVSKDGKVIEAIVDSVEPAFSVDAKGAVQGEYTPDNATKYEKGDEYGMKQYSSVKKEWYEQANAFMAAVKGKNKEEIAALADNTGKAGEDLTGAGCTVNVSGLISATVKAISE